MRISGSGGGGGASIQAWVTDLKIKPDNMYLYLNNLYKAITEHTAGVSFIPANFQLIGGLIGSFVFKGNIDSNDDFPTVAAANIGYIYKITVNVTDNDITKTNTGLVFKAGDEIAWDGTTWINLGPILNWSAIIDKPQTFPPATHNHDLVYSILAHDHSGVYAILAHDHSGVYAIVAHSHDGAYSALAHSHAFSAITSTPEGISDIPTLNASRKEPNGFVNRTDSTIVYDLANKRITVSGTFVYYNQGTKYSKATVSEAVEHAASVGFYCVYYVGSVLTIGAVGIFFDLSIHTPICMVLYNGTAATTYWSGAEGIVIEERHGLTMDWDTHQTLHNNIGTYVRGAGFALNGTYAVATGSGGLVDVSYGVDSGVVCDEDISITLDQLSDNAGVGNQYPVFYRVGTGTEWRWLVTNIPLIKDNNNDILFNKLDGSTWGLKPITVSGKYLNMYLCATTVKNASSGNDYKFIWVIGQTEHSTLANAQSETMLSLNLSGLLFSEIAPLWQITMVRNSAYETASGKSRVESVRRIVGTRVSIALTFNPQDHNNLANRASSNAHPGTSISTDTTSFANVLTASETDVQLALAKLDAGSATYPKIKVGHTPPSNTAHLWVDTN